MRFKRALLIFAIFFLSVGVTSLSLADEGMWMPHQMKDLNLKDLGLKMNPDDLYKKDGTGLMSAVVYLGGGTGGFVSLEGLILTNHHVAFGALQRASTEEKDYIKNGFIAWSKDEEISAKGYIADVLLGYEKVTDEVLSRISPQMTYMEKYNAIDRAKKKLIARAEKEGKDIRCTVASMYSGNEYYLFRFKRIKDPEEEIPSAFKGIVGKHSEKAVDDYVDHLYDKTSLADPKKRLELLDKKPAELVKLNDPVLNLAAELEKEMKVLREEKKALDQERLELKKVYVDSLMKLKEGRIAPDANSTIRFTYGFVEGYYPQDAVYYLPQTALKGVIEKDTGKFPLHVPEKLKELYTEKDFGPYIDKKLKDIPACFLNTTNVTGGNSGSPTLNAKGEQVGIIFDMTYESVIGDYYIIPELQRTISVDIRYVLFITDKFSGAKHIIKELGY